MRILVVEDEPKLNQSIVRGLKQRGFAVDPALDGEEGETMARMNEYDVIVLDIMMPKRDGLTVCKDLRQAGIMTPIIFLTAKDSLSDKVEGLYDGADDYIVKPFSFEELTARIHTVLRRSRVITPDIQEWDKLTLNSRTSEVAIAGKEISLTLKEFSLLEYLLRNRDRVISREDIIEHVWDHAMTSFSNLVDVHLKNLRKKLPASYANSIETIRGKGYRIVA